MTGQDIKRRLPVVQGHVTLGTYAAVGCVVSGAVLASAALWFYSRRWALLWRAAGEGRVNKPTRCADRCSAFSSPPWTASPLMLPVEQDFSKHVVICIGTGGPFNSCCRRCGLVRAENIWELRRYLSVHAESPSPPLC